MCKVRFYREKEKKSIKDTSDYLGITQRHLQFIEKGERMPSLLLAKKMADYLSSTIEELFFDEV